MIIIDKNYRIETDGLGCSLLFEAKAEKIVKGEMVEVNQRDVWDFLNVEQCLNRYLDLAIEPNPTVEEVLKSIKEVRLTIKNAMSQPTT